MLAACRRQQCTLICCLHALQQILSLPRSKPCSFNSSPAFHHIHRDCGSRGCDRTLHMATSQAMAARQPQQLDAAAAAPSSPVAAAVAALVAQQQASLQVINSSSKWIAML